MFILKSSNWDFWLSNHQSQQKVLIQHSPRLTHLCVLIAHRVTTEGLVPKTNPINVQSIKFPPDSNSTDVCYWHFRTFRGFLREQKKWGGKKQISQRTTWNTSKPGDVIFCLGIFCWASKLEIKSKSPFLPSIVDVHRCFFRQYFRTPVLIIPTIWRSTPFHSKHVLLQSSMISLTCPIPWPSLQAFLLSLSGLTVDILIVLISWTKSGDTPTFNHLGCVKKLW